MPEIDLRELVNQAAFLHERLTGGWIPDDSPANRQAAQARLERWCQLAAGGDRTRFAHRLAWDGLDTDSALRLLYDGHLADRDELPAWADFLAQVLAQPSAAAGALDPAAFAQPFVDAAQARLNRAVGDRLGRLSPIAQSNLAGNLSERLAALAGPALAHHPLLFGSHTLCRAYPVLARQLCTAALLWAESVQEFLSRLAADWSVLSTQTGVSPHPAPGCVVSISPGLSDPHRGGRTVWRVDLAGGVSVAYKPKELALDRAWNDLLGWCNERGLTPELACLWTLPRAGYGWMEWVESRAASDLPLFYRRMGLLLGLLHLLHASDVHRENLIGRGAHPLLIDAEMLLYPQITGQADDPLDVLRTGLLPRWIGGRDGVGEIGGLSGEAVSTHWEEIVAGYETLCRFVKSHWNPLHSVDGPLTPFRLGHIRFAPRPTAAYIRLLEYLRHPAFLKRGSDFSIETDRLAYSYSRTEQRATFRPLLPEEHAAIAQGDVPFFSAAADGQVVASSGGSFALPLCWPAFAPPALPEQAQQAQLIRASLERSAYLPTEARGERSFLAWAIRLGEALAQRAVSLEGGGVGWVRIQFQPKSGLHQHGLLGDDLYAGRAGIGLFLAGIYRATGAEKWRNLALSALRLDRPFPDGDGQLYALALCSHLLAAPELMGAPELLDKLRLPAEDPSARGVLDGQAGLLLGLLAMYEQTADAALLERAAACGERLLAGADGWLHPATGLGGFSHGAAGIALALAKLYEASGEPRFLDGARRGWAFQRSLYDESADNWQDRRGAVPVYLANWCNGAAGIGLAAVGSLAALPEVADVVERAGGLLTAAEPPFLDTLCCGSFGQIECLLELGLRLDRPGWISGAIVQARGRLDAASTRGTFTLYDDLPAHLFNPAFFRGVAGIGYTLLRLARANREMDAQLPSVLSWSV